MTLSIQLPGIGEYRTQQRVNLDGTVYTLRISWNERASGWFLDVSDADGKIASGRHLSTDWFPLLRDVGRRGPSGQLFFFGTLSDAEAGIDLSNYRLMYYSASEIAGLAP